MRKRYGDGGGAGVINGFFAVLRECRGRGGGHERSMFRSQENHGMTAGEAVPAVPVPEIAAFFAGKRDLRIVGYGSLMWDPGFAYGDAAPALLHGYHRRFCIYSHRYRGTLERPGLVLGLDHGGACKGIAFRVPAADAEATLRYLWDREMTNRVYRLVNVPVEIAGGTVRAYAFVVDRAHPSYAGRLTLDETARLIRQGVGGRGACRQYLENTVRRLEELGVADGPLHRLERRVRELAAGETPGAPG
jgi:cation transport protein ChaC